MLETRWYQTEAIESIFNFYREPREFDPVTGKPKPKNALICLPTGTGKSIVIGLAAKLMFERVKETRLIMQTHVKELIKQNSSKLLEVWPGAPLGIYSAGMKQRDSIQPIIFGGIQSCVGKYPIFGFRDFLFIDEAHLVGDEGSYLKFIDELMLKNPWLKIIGLSATAYRLGLGCLTNGKIFTDIIYDLCNIDGFARLINEGYLAPLIGKKGNIEIDVSEVSVDSTGDYSKGQLSAAIKKQHKTREQLTEFVAYGQNRRCWIAFAAGIEEAEEINDLLNQDFNIQSAVMHSKMGDAHNSKVLEAWKIGDIRCVVNMNMLTTGVDNPMLDYMGDFAPTTSTGKHVQKNGRLTRPFPGKLNGLIMDYAGNIRRLGPINNPVIPRKRGTGAAGDAPVKICKACDMYNFASAVECVFCKATFLFQDKTTRTAWDGDVLAPTLPDIRTIDVDRCIYTAHVSKAIKAANPFAKHSELPFTIKCSYFCNLKVYYEWITVEGKGGNAKGRDWFRQRYRYGNNNMPFVNAKGEASDVPPTNSQVLAIVSNLRAPTSIDVHIDCKPEPRVIRSNF